MPVAKLALFLDFNVTLNEIGVLRKRTMESFCKKWGRVGIRFGVTLLILVQMI
jgi:hypothetical protein